MSDTASLIKCRTYIDCQLGSLQKPGAAARRTEGPSITISRQTGSGGNPIAELLAAYLQNHGPKTGCPWTVFHKNLMGKVLEEHHLPKRLAQYLPEDRGSYLADMVEEILGLHPPSWTMFHQTSETVLRLAEMGNAILIGRGANVITSKLDNVYHFRVVGSEEQCLRRVQEHFKLGRKAALALMRKEEAGRRRYVKKYFHADIDDPLLYHMVLNTDRISFEQAAQIIGDYVLNATR